ncbi:class I SAM-dependent methyltransferase [Haloferula sp.]|uniref:class I SAM-dependent methyltransferase n=1 Tax=Haloferula sp. TaxID=2497595 RepID=UPI00329EB040
MEPSDWIEAAGNYQQEVASVFDRDKKGMIRSLIEEHAGSKKSCIDLGCGPGRFLPTLSEHFGLVHACDYSKDMIREARKQTVEPHLSFECCDLRRGTPSTAPADVVLCVNALLHPDLAAREAMWRNVAKSVKKGGVLLLVAPALESALLARHRLAEWNLRSGVPARSALLRSFADEDPDAISIARGGIMDAGGTLTKHYLREELESTAARHRLRIEHCAKIEYSWKTEFHQPPRWMKSPYPWDWLAVMRRV